MEDLKILFGKRVKKFRLKNKFSQEELAEKVGIALNNMGKIERGESFVTASTLEKLSQALNIEIEELFCFNEYKSINEMKKELNTILQNDDNICLLYKIYKMVIDN